MKLSNVVAEHGFAPSQLGEIENAKLYARHNEDGVMELLCVQKVRNVMRVDRQPLLPFSTEEFPMFFPIGTGVRNQIVPRDSLEDYLNITLAV